MATVSAERLAEVFVEVADTLVTEFDVIEFLQLLSARTAELLDAGAVGLLLADQQGKLQFMAASEEEAKLLELFELQHQEGPASTPSPVGRRSSLRTSWCTPVGGRSSCPGRWPPVSARCTGCRCGCGVK